MPGSLLTAFSRKAQLDWSWGEMMRSIPKPGFDGGAATAGGRGGVRRLSAGEGKAGGS